MTEPDYDSEIWVTTGDEYVQDPNNPDEVWTQTADSYTDGVIDSEDQ